MSQGRPLTPTEIAAALRKAGTLHDIPLIHEFCNICGKRIASISTRNLGEHYFCSECHDTIVYPVTLAVADQLVLLFGGNEHGNPAARQRFAESIVPGRKSKLVIGFAVVGEAQGTVRGDSEVSAIDSRGGEDSGESSATAESPYRQSENNGEEAGA